MKNTGKKDIIFSLAVAALVFGLGYYFLSTQTLKTSLDQEKEVSASLSNDKKKLEQDIARFQDEIGTLTGNNARLNKIIDSTKAALDAQVAVIKNLKSTNASIVKQRDEFRRIKEDLVKELAQLRDNYHQILSKNDSLDTALEQMRNELSVLRQENASMQNKMAENILVETMAKNGKPVVVAKRVKTIRVSLDVVKVSQEEAYCLLVPPTGKVVSSKNEKWMTVKVTDTRDGTKNTGIGTSVKKHIECKFDIQSKLSSGTYNVEIFNQSSLIKSVRFVLR